MTVRQGSSRGAFRLLSAAGPAALSIWELRAPAGWWAAFLGRNDLPAPGRPRLVRIRDGEGNDLDEGLLRVCAAGPEVRAELHLHGGSGVAARLRSRLGELGWRESGGPVPQDEDFARVLKARAPWNARAAADAWHGCFENAWKQVPSQGPPGPEEAAIWRERLAWAGWVEAPPRVALAGPPNTGKSALFNAWVREERVTVSPHPGTTRDCVEAGILLGKGDRALEARLIDTAGLWKPSRELDRLALEGARAALRTAQRVIWVFDAAGRPDPEALQAFRERSVPCLKLLHRTDLGEAWDPEEIAGGVWLRGSVQAEGEECIARLEQALLASLGPLPAEGTPLPLGKRRRGLVGEYLERGETGGRPRGAAPSRGIQ